MTKSIDDVTEKSADAMRELVSLTGDLAGMIMAILVSVECLIDTLPPSTLWEMRRRVCTALEEQKDSDVAHLDTGFQLVCNTMIKRIDATLNDPDRNPSATPVSGSRGQAPATSLVSDLKPILAGLVRFLK